MVVSTPRVDDPMILVVAMVAFCIFIIIIIFFESINLQYESNNNSTSYSCFCEYDFVMRIIIAFSIEVRKHFDEERAKESDGERESIIRMRVVQKLFVLLLCCVVQKSFSLRPYSN